MSIDLHVIRLSVAAHGPEAAGGICRGFYPEIARGNLREVLLHCDADYEAHLDRLERYRQRDARMCWWPITCICWLKAGTFRCREPCRPSNSPIPSIALVLPEEGHWC